MMQSAVKFCYAGSYRTGWPNDVHIREHVHSGTELVLVTRGVCTSVFSGGVTLTGRENFLFVIPPGIRHDQRGINMTLYMEFDLPENEIPAHVRLLDVRRDPFLRVWMHSLLELGSNARPPETHFLAAAVWTRLRLLLRDSETELSPYVSRALKYIEAHSSDPGISANEIAHAAGCCVSHLDMLFRRARGCGAMRYLYSRRMEHARQLLENPYRTLEEIAGLCGFRNANYFIRAFRKAHGRTPGKFRVSISIK